MEENNHECIQHHQYEKGNATHLFIAGDDQKKKTEYYSQKNKTIWILMATIKGETLLLLSENIFPAFKIWKRSNVGPY